MHQPPLSPLVAGPLLLATLLTASPAFANNCEAISAQIDAKLRQGGLQQFSLVTVEATASAAGRPMGSCDRGSKKILYRAASAADTPQPPARRGDSPILTECKDGTVSMGGNCRK